MDAARAALLESVASQLAVGGLRVGVEPDGDNPAWRVLIGLQEDRAGRRLELQLMFLPGLDDPPVLQCYVGLPYEVEPSRLAEVCRAVAALNVNVPLGGFGFLEATGRLYYRHTMAISLSDPGLVDVDALGWSIATATYVVASLAPLLEDATKGVAHSELIEQLRSVLALERAAVEDSADS